MSEKEKKEQKEKIICNYRGCEKEAEEGFKTCKEHGEFLLMLAGITWDGFM